MMELELEAIAYRLEQQDKAALIGLVQKLIRLWQGLEAAHGRVVAQVEIQGQLMAKARQELERAHGKLVTKHGVGKDAGHCGVCAAYYSLEAVELK